VEEKDERAAGRVGMGRVWREATAMTLYVSIVLLAELVALPEGIVGWELVAIVWGTTIGLLVAHTFAFQVATHGMSGGWLRGEDRIEVLLELAGVASVAAVASAQVMLFGDSIQHTGVSLAVCVSIGAVAYFVERLNDRSRTSSLVFSSLALLVALLVAAVKAVLAH
jgi:hypothetical protein